MITEGYTKIYRSFLNWQWYKDSNTFRLFFHLILTANFTDGFFMGKPVKRGQRIVSVQTLSNELNISVRSIRTSINHLKSTNEVTIGKVANCSIITINNYNKYQALTNELTNDRQMGDKRLTNDRQQYKKEKKEIKKNKERMREGTLSPHGFFSNVFLTDSELSELAQRYPEHYEAKIERLSRYLESTGKTYRNHFSTLIEWLEEDAGKAEAQKTKRNASYDISEVSKIDTLDFVE